MRMTILMNDFQRQWEEIGTDVLAGVERVGRSGWYILGSEVSEFEKELAAFLDTSFCVGCASGLDAIELALRALDLQPGQRVLTTPLSAFATTLAIVRAGGVPLFVDTDEAGNLDLNLVEECLRDRPEVRFVLPVHLFGNLLDLERLAAIRERYGVKVVEDCAQALGAVGGPGPGSVGDLAATSFYPTKNLGTLGDGGAVFTSSASLTNVCRALRDYGQSAKYVHTRLGMNSRLDEMHAAILRTAMLPRLALWSARRAHVARRYREELCNPRVHLLPVSNSSWHLFPVRVEAALRPGFLHHLAEQGVQSGIHYPTLIPDQPAMADIPFERHGGLGRAQRLAAQEVSLPINPHLTDDEVSAVVSTINAWCPQ